jgi:hypothetical protein
LTEVEAIGGLFCGSITMLWPAATPDCIVLPEIPPGKDGLATDRALDSRILDIERSKPGYVFVALTWRGIYLFRPKPFCPVAVYIRTKQSVDDYGQNVSLTMRNDGRILAVATSTGYILTYNIVSQESPSEVSKFIRSSSSDDSSGFTVFPGAGEAVGVRELRIRFSVRIRVDSGISHIVALENHLMVITRSPQAIQLIKWSSMADPDVSPRTSTVLLSDLEWLTGGTIVHVTRSKAMSVFSFTTESGAVFSGTVDEQAVEPGRRGSSSSADPPIKPTVPLLGHCFHEGSDAIQSAINARFSEIAVGCRNGSIHLYNIRDYSGNVKLIRTVAPPLSSAGSVQCMRWSTDGYALFVGYETGWALFSVYGMLNASSFLSGKGDRESWLGGISQANWSFSGDSLFIVARDSPTCMWHQSMLKWNGAGNFTHENLQRPVLLSDNKILIYRGQEQPDLTTIDRDALLWLTVTIPGGYMAENWPIKYVSSSIDGRYIAIAGMRGLAHYSLYSGRWKMFVEDYMDREFTVRGGMVWAGHYLVAAVDTDHYTHEIRIYSRELELDPENLIFSQEIPAPILKISVVRDLLIVYTHANVLYMYRLSSLGHSDLRTLDLEYEVSLSGIVHSPARVREIGCLPKCKDHHLKLSNVNFILLVDGMLIILEPDDSGLLKKRILHHNVEYYAVTPGTKNSHSMLWAFDGKDLLVWLKDTNRQKDQSPSTMAVESYPLAVLVDKGIMTGIETDAVVSREGNFTYFKYFTSTQLFVPHILESYLELGETETALSVANEYKHLKYFSHILEMLLYQILFSDEKVVGKEESLLLKATTLICQFPQMLDVFLGCTRKTEVKYWTRLFDIIGAPQELFERCILLGKLKSAAGYLLVLHSLDKFEERNSENTERLFKMAYEAGDWDLCKELSRFLTAVDRKY